MQSITSLGAMPPPCDLHNSLVVPSSAGGAHFAYRTAFAPWLLVQLSLNAHPRVTTHCGPAAPACMAWTPDGLLLASASRRIVTLCDYCEHAALVSKRAVNVRYDVKAMAIARTENGRLLLATASVRGAEVRFVGDPDNAVTLLAQSYSICQIAISPSGSHLVLCASEGYLGIWAVANFARDAQVQVALNRVHVGALVTSLAATDDFVAVATWSGDKSHGIHVFNAPALSKVNLAFPPSFFAAPPLSSGAPSSFLIPGPAFCALVPSSRFLITAVHRTVAAFALPSGECMALLAMDYAVVGLGVVCLPLGDVAELVLVRSDSGALDVLAPPSADGCGLREPESPWREPLPKVVNGVHVSRGALRHPVRGLIFAPVKDACAFGDDVAVLLRNGVLKVLRADNGAPWSLCDDVDHGQVATVPGHGLVLWSRWWTVQWWSATNDARGAMYACTPPVPWRDVVYVPGKDALLPNRLLLVRADLADGHRLVLFFRCAAVGNVRLDVAANDWTFVT